MSLTSIGRRCTSRRRRSDDDQPGNQDCRSREPDPRDAVAPVSEHGDRAEQRAQRQEVGGVPPGSRRVETGDRSSHTAASGVQPTHFPLTTPVFSGNTHRLPCVGAPCHMPTHRPCTSSSRNVIGSTSQLGTHRTRATTNTSIAITANGPWRIWAMFGRGRRSRRPDTATNVRAGRRTGATTRTRS